MAVRIWEEKLVIPTYEVGEENIIPDLREEGNQRVYPYTRNLHLTDKKKDVTYNVVYIENEYMKICVMPEKGGRIYSAVDKVSGKEMFYKGPSIKPALIQLYGAWIAGGLEFNFPMGHNITSFKNVDYSIEKHPTFATVTVGNIDLATRMRWQVRITLHDQRRFIELLVKLDSRTYLPERYYFWANSAVDATDGLKSILPSSRVESGGQLLDFPIDKSGRDISKYKNWPHSVDLFVIDCKEDFFGCYNDDYDFGFAHYSNRFEEYGKKFFTWGNDEAGLLWRKALADGNTPPYAEYQCGPLRTQGNFQILKPYQSNNWYEYWMPVYATKGFVKANKDIILNLELKDGAAQVRLNVTGKIKNAVISLYVNGKVKAVKKTTLLPEEPFYEAFILGRIAKNDKVLVTISDDVRELINYEREASKIGLYESEEHVKQEYKDIYQKLYLQGVELEKQRLYRDARRKYMEVLDKDPKYIPALLRLGILSLILGQFEAARDWFKEVREKDPNNLDVCYYLGLAYKFLGNNKKARENLWRLNMNEGGYSVGAFVEIGKIDLIEGDYEEAARALRNAYVRCAHSPKLSGLYSAALRKAGKINQSIQISRDFGGWEPVDVLSLNEDWLVNKNKRSWETLRRVIKRDKENALELSMDYISAGLYEEALEVLKLGAKVFPDYPLYYYHMGYCLEKQGKVDSAKKMYVKGATVKGKRVFPWQLETYIILKNAAEKWVPKYPNTYEYLGNFLFYKMRYGEGLEKFYLAKKLGSKSPVVFRNIALGHLRHKRDVHKMAKAYVDAVRNSPTEWETYYEADYILTGYGRMSERKEMYKMVSATDKVFEHPKAMERKAKILLDLGKYDEGISVITKHTFYPWEGEAVARRVYEDLYNSRAEQLIRNKKYSEALKNLETGVQYPETLGIGKHKTRVHARNLYLLGLIQAALKEYGGAGKYWNEITKTEVDPSLITRLHIYLGFPFENLFYYALVQAETGKSKKAAKVLSGLLKARRGDYISLVNIVEYLTAYGFLKNDKKVSVKSNMLCGRKIPAVIKSFLKVIAGAVNKKRVTVK